eukprot:8366977-Alexandrium_andersonii.AAC.1
MRCKLGLTDREGKAYWLELYDDPNIGRDNDGYGGEEQLYVPLKYRFKHNLKFIEAEQVEGSKELKDPSEQDREMLKQHVHAQQLGYTN